MTAEATFHTICFVGKAVSVVVVVVVCVFVFVETPEENKTRRR